MKKMFTVKKVTSAAILTALATLSTIIFKLIPMGSLSLLRFSLTPALIIYSSLALGPVLGAVVGAGSDLIPAIIAPTGALNPFITIVYGLLGILPWALEFLTKKVRSSLRRPYSFYVAVAIIYVGVAIPMFVTSFFEDKFKEYAVFARVFALILLLIASILCCVVVTLSNKKYEKNLLETSTIPSPNEVALISLFCEIVIMCAGKSLAFTLFYGTPYWLAFYTIFLGLPINLAISTIVVYWMLVFDEKQLHLRRSIDE